MASIHPFRALRPTPERAADVSSVPYDVVSTEEARQLAADNPLSFLRVTRSEIDLPAGVDPYSSDVYARARSNFDELRRQAPLVIEDAPSLYLYRLRMGTHEQTGIAGCFSVDEYENDVIKKHERTRRDKEDDRTRHIVELRAQTGVVFLTYKAAPRHRFDRAACHERDAAVRLHGRGWRPSHHLARRRRRCPRPRTGLRHHPCALHRGWSSPRRQCRESACRAESPGRCHRSRYLYCRGVP